MTKQPKERVTSRPRGGYGLWVTVVRTADGRRVEGYGWGEKQSLLKALAKAREVSHAG